MQGWSWGMDQGKSGRIIWYIIWGVKTREGLILGFVFLDYLQDIEHILNEDILSVCGYFLTWSRTSRAHTLNNTTLFLFQLIINRNLGILNVQTGNKLPNSDITAPLFKTHRPSLFNNSGLYSIIRLILVHWFQLLQRGGYRQQIHWP